MIKQKFSFFLAAAFGICLLSILVTTGCNEKKSSTETTAIDSSSMSTPMPAMDTMTMPVDTNAMDTATTRPIVPGT